MIKVGKVITTHGIKGEIKLRSDFKYKTKVFKENNVICINKQSYVIEGCKVHKGCYLIKLKEYDNINQVLFLKNKDVYYLKQSLELTDNEYLNEDLLGFKVFEEDKLIGKVINVDNNLIQLKGKKIYLIPHVFDIIRKIDFKEKAIIIKYLKGLIK